VGTTFSSVVQLKMVHFLLLFSKFPFVIFMRLKIVQFVLLFSQVSRSDESFIHLCQVRFAQISESGKVSTKRLGTHRGRVHKLAIEPGSPHIFYSCGEDGLVQHVANFSNCLYQNLPRNSPCFYLTNSYCFAV